MYKPWELQRTHQGKGSHVHATLLLMAIIMTFDLRAGPPLFDLNNNFVVKGFEAIRIDISIRYRSTPAQIIIR